MSWKSVHPFVRNVANRHGFPPTKCIKIPVSKGLNVTCLNVAHCALCGKNSWKSVYPFVRNVTNIHGSAPHQKILYPGGDPEDPQNTSCLCRVRLNRVFFSIANRYRTLPHPQTSTCFPRLCLRGLYQTLYQTLPRRLWYPRVIQLLWNKIPRLRYQIWR